MASFREHLEQFLWDEVFGRSETHPKMFTMKDAWSYFFDLAEKHGAKSCVFQVEPKGDCFEITQLLLNEDGEVMKASKDYCVGRKIKADEIDDSVVLFLKGESRRIMKLPE